MAKRRCSTLAFGLLLLVVAARQSVAQQPRPQSISLYEKDVLLVADGTQLAIRLPDSLLVPGTDSVWLDGRALQRATDYQIDYGSGTLYLRQLPAPGAQVRLLYQRFPYELPRVYRRRPLHRLPADTSSAALPQGFVARPAPSQTYGADLQKSGSIVRGITIGSNRGLKVDSGLRMQVAGRVSENLEVVASLTDQNTPIQPEGNTQTLQEIDKVFVELKGRDVQVTMGDYYLELTGTEFAGYARKLQGAMATVRHGGVAATASGAVSRGQFRTQYFLGQEGYQGPYQLKGERGQIDIIVLAGTEKVWVDGELMVRGETNDYVIDYSTAQITFTRRRLITADSRITVDFQYSDERFRRNIYALRTTANPWADKLQVGLSYLREADAKDHPLDFSLTEQRLALLRAAGDDPAKAVEDGATYVGPGKGRYQLDASGVFRYVGPDSGAYNVSFADVGEGKGDYAYEGGGVYRFVGHGAGRYSPVVLLPVARSHDLFGADLSFSPHPFLKVRAEGAMSRFDANSYSELDDDDNRGLASGLSIELKPERLRLFGAILGTGQLTARLRRVDSHFADIDRTTAVEYERRWDLPDSLTRQEVVHELVGQYSPGTGLEFRGEYGGIRKGSAFAASRVELQSSLARPRLPRASYRFEFIDRAQASLNKAGTWLRQRGSVDYQWWKLRPMLGYENEVRKEQLADTLSSGFRFDLYQAGLELVNLGRMSGAAKLSYRDDRDYRGGAFTRKSVATTQTYQWSIQRWRSLSASAEFTHRERSYADPQISDQRTDLAEVKASFSPWRQALSSEWHYQVANTAVAKKERVYLKVSPGDGNYRFDAQLNEYVPDPLGDYVLRTFTTDQFVPVVELRTSGKIRLDPRQFFSRSLAEGRKSRWGERVLSALATETLVRIEEKSREPDPWQIYRLNLARFQRDETTMFGLMTLRQDLYVLQNSRKASVRLRYQGRKEKNNQYLEGGQDQRLQEWSARVTSQLSPQVGLQVDAAQERNVRAFRFAGRQNRDIRSHGATVALSYRPKPILELALKAKMALQKDVAFTPATNARFAALQPAVVYSLPGKGQVRADIEWVNVGVEQAGRAIPYELAEGNQPGTTLRWNIAAEYRVSDNVRASLTYSGRSEPQRPEPVHIAKAEMRAFF
ncbi:MAG: hypothetical protein NUW13_10050 [candidate division KSB1 bacterium]|nr:hypothetical protein [candidate division KSB1 bacterium]